MPHPNTIPPGYWQDANGNLVPESKVKDIDKLRHQVVTDLCAMARQQRDGLRQFKHGAFGEVAALVATSLEQYGVKTGGEKGNVTLVSFDGRFKVVRHMHDHIVFGEQLMAAKALIDARPNPTDDEIRKALERNLCRCGTYPRIRAAIHQAARGPQG